MTKSEAAVEISHNVETIKALLKRCRELSYEFNVTFDISLVESEIDEDDPDWLCSWD